MVTTYFMNCIMGNLFRSKTSPALPATYYLGVSKTAPTLTGGNITEPTGGGYTRVQIKSFSAPQNGVITNSETIAFPECTSDWGEISHFILCDSASRGSGNLLMFEKLAKTKNIHTENTLVVRENGLEFSLKNVSE